MSSNADVARLLYQIGELYSLQGDFFRSRAYLRAAQRIEAFPENIRTLHERGKLETIPGVGKGIGTTIDKYLTTGASSHLEELRESLPPGVLALLSIEGIGPKTALRLTRELGITSIAQLEKAAKNGQLRNLKGFGQRSEQSILQAIQTFQGQQQRFLLNQILPVVEEIKTLLAQCSQVQQIEVAGSARRMKETVGDLDILIAAENGLQVTEQFITMPDVARVVSQGKTRSTVILRSNLQVDLRVVPRQSFGAALQYFTGSKEHNIKLRGIASDQGYKLNEYGLFTRDTDTRIAGSSEPEIYAQLGFAYIEPELREHRGEIEAAAHQALPQLIEMADIKGDLHVHSDWSDGIHSIPEIAEAASKRGFEYVAICDHSQALGIAHGLNEDRLRKQVQEIEAVNASGQSCEVLKGIEVDILSTGHLDLPNQVLQELDFVIASIHSGFKDEAETLTNRLLTAIHNDTVSAIGHPTGRLIQRRAPYAFNLERVFDAAMEQHVVLEINAFPDRLDLNDVNCRTAQEHGVMMSIGTDAHSINHLNYLRYGVAVARRGWLQATDILNSRSLPDLRRSLQR
ncbi:MAG: DNA polymerase/3'-5' exonuclease PolX [Candidatus Bathyarchaeota archaeon]|nr:DNA polymerase/3'-5' exonuclease PolX [Candidatus Bathyarchaeota archaeon]